jgi:hypothetical protein
MGMNAARRARQKENRRAGGHGHDHPGDRRCLVCKPRSRHDLPIAVPPTQATMRTLLDAPARMLQGGAARVQARAGQADPREELAAAARPANKRIGLRRPLRFRPGRGGRKS